MTEALFFEINKSKIKGIAFIYFSLAIGIISFTFFISTIVSKSIEIYIWIGGGILAAFFVIAGMGVYKSLRKESAGIKIDEKAIYDSISSLSIPEIRWKYIVDFKKDEEQQVIFVLVKQADELINSVSNNAIKRVLKKNVELYKTPVIVETKYLNVSTAELFDTFMSTQKKFGKK